MMKNAITSTAENFTFIGIVAVLVWAIFAMVTQASAEEFQPLDNSSYVMTVGGTSTQTTTTLSGFIDAVRLVCTAACYVAIGASPQTAAFTAGNATGQDIYLPADTPQVFRVPRSTQNVIAAIQVSSGGTLYITEMSK